MKTILLTNNKIRLEFTIKDDNRVVCSYFGNEANFINRESTFIEIETSEQNHLGSHCAKQCNTPFGKEAKYVSHILKENELILITKDNLVQAETHFRLYDGVSGLSVFNKITNISLDDVHLEYVSSFYLYGLGQKESLTFKDMSVYYCSNSWTSEIQWKKESFIDANIFNGNNRLTMKKFELNNSGSWSTKQYLPMIGISNDRTNQFILGQVENNGSWHIEIGDNENQYYLSMSGPEMVDNQWCLSLKPNEEFVTVSASIVIGNDYEESVQEITKLRRYLVKRNHIDYINQPVTFNDFMHGTWDQSSEELLKPYIDVASEVGCDTFIVDAGWFAKTSGWPNYIGEYGEYSDNYPSGGLKGLFDYMRKKNLKTGLWFEIENVGISSSVATSLKEEAFMHINGRRIIKNSRYCLNLCNEEAFNHAYNKIANKVKEYNLDYIKLDYNLDLGVGNDDEDKFLGVGLLKQNKKVIGLIQKLENEFPNLTIENCASGGQRLDYAMLKEAQIVSSSDLENYAYYPYISGNMYTAAIPEQSSIWAYPVCNDAVKFDITDEIVIYNMVNGLVGRLTLSSKLFLLTDEQKSLVKEGITLAHDLLEFRKEALPIYPNGFTRFFSNNVVCGLMDDDRAILYVFNTSEYAQDMEIDLSKYNINNVKQIYPVKHEVKYDFKNNKLNISFPNGLMARIFELKRK